MKVLVTGAAGFIGSFTSHKLLDRGDEVIGVDNLNDYYDVNLKHARLARLQDTPGFHFAQFDIADTAALTKLFQEHKPDRVVHLAAQAGVRYSLENPQAYIDANPKGKHGKHEYALSDYGLTRELIDERFAFYTADGRWPISS